MTLQRILTFLFFCLPLFVSAQNTIWQTCTGGNAMDNAYAFDITPDGSYIIVGTTRSYDMEGLTKENGDADILVVKMNSKGKVLWRRTYGGSFNDEPRDVRVTRDGGFIIVGNTDSKEYTKIENKRDVFVLRLDAVGALLWTSAFGGTGNDGARCVRVLNDGSYMIGGETGSNNGHVTGQKGGVDFWMLRVSDKGKLIWQKTFGGSNNEFITGMAETREGYYIFSGPSDSNNEDLQSNNGKTDVFLVCVDTSGYKKWKKSFGGNSFDEPYDLLRTNDMNYIITGTTYSTAGDIAGKYGKNDAYLVKFDAQGNILWSNTYGGSGDDGANSVTTTFDGDFIVSATSGSKDGLLKSNNGGIDAWIFKVNKDGKLLWQKTLGGSKDEQCSAVKEIPGGDFVSLGFTSSEDGDLDGVVKYGNNDFWAFCLEDPDNKSKNVISLTPTTIIGYIRDAKTKKYIVAEVQLIDNNKNERITAVKSDTTFGIYQLFLPDVDKTSIGVFKEGYMFFTKNIDISPEQRYSEIRLDIELMPIGKGERVNLYNINFDIGKATLRPDSKPELDRIITFMNQNPNAVVRINGHTDNTGDPKTKQQLSSMRAEAVRDYLIANGGIKSWRLQILGHGMSQPLSTNETEEGRQMNRRVEFEIISNIKK